MRFIEYDLRSEALCMGERVKGGGLYRPCCRTIRYSQISGALRRKCGVDLHAAGYLVDGNGFNRTEHFTYAPNERVTGISKIPLRVEYLSNVRGKVFIAEVEPMPSLPDAFEIDMGALISKGFGRCQLARRGTVEDRPIVQGSLRTRIPLSKVQIFGIRNVITPVYGYLFEPTSLSSGVYVLSLFEGSEVVAPSFLVSAVERR